MAHTDVSVTAPLLRIKAVRKDEPLSGLKLEELAVIKVPTKVVSVIFGGGVSGVVIKDEPQAISESEADAYLQHIGETDVIGLDFKP